MPATHGSAPAAQGGAAALPAAAPAARGGAAMPRVFTTVGLPAGRRIELWERHNAAALIGLSCHPAGPGPLEATEVNVSLGRVQLARVTGSAHAVTRDARLVRRDPADAVAVYLTLRGAAWFRDEGGTRDLRPGQVLICDADRPFARGFAHGLEELAIKVPRPAFAAATGLAAPGAPLVAGLVTGLVTGLAAGFGPGGDPYARALARLAGRAARARQPVTADEATVLDLVAVLAAGPGADRTTAFRAAACSFIEDHLADPCLGAAQVAAAVGISERHLSRVFAAGLTTLPRHVLSRRLQLAHAMLAGPGGPGLTVAEVAARCGFASAAYFSHAFRQRFGVRASEARRQTRDGVRAAGQGKAGGEASGAVRAGEAGGGARR
jgi:AraC-like DNA-binding protein